MNFSHFFDSNFHYSIPCKDSTEQTKSVKNSSLSRIMFIAFEDIFSSFLHFPRFLFTVTQREMTGKTTALSFLDVYKQIHTQRKQYLQLLVYSWR